MAFSVAAFDNTDRYLAHSAQLMARAIDLNFKNFTLAFFLERRMLKLEITKAPLAEVGALWHPGRVVWPR